jgi:uncharacterized protein YqgC (DUF456 family)
MELTIEIIAVVAGIIGIVGSIIPGLPGVPISWLGMLTLYIWGNGTNSAGDPLSLTLLIVWAVIVIAVTVLDYIVPPIITKKMGGSKYAEKGSIFGMLFGMIFTPIGMILGAFLGALLAELVVAKKKNDEALKAAIGSFLGFILGTGIKTIAAVCIFWYIIVYLN